MLSFYAGIILYNPTQKEIKNIIKYKESFEKVIIFDNSDDGNNEIYFQEDTWIYYKAKTNNGISKAINYMIDLCQKRNIDFLCTLDQDSVFDSKNIDVLEQYIDNNYKENVAVYAPRIVYLNRKQKLIEDGIIEKKWVITSGNFINIKSVCSNSIKYDEQYFIDRCDRDFCMQIEKAKLKIVVNNESVLYQQLGTAENNGKMGHGVLRHYYMFRNRLYYNNKYYIGVEKLYRNIFQMIRQLYVILVEETDKLKKIKMFTMAVADYKKGRMGKYGS